MDIQFLSTLFVSTQPNLTICEIITTRLSVHICRKSLGYAVYFVHVHDKNIFCQKFFIHIKKKKMKTKRTLQCLNFKLQLYENTIFITDCKYTHVRSRHVHVNIKNINNSWGESRKIREGITPLATNAKFTAYSFIFIFVLFFSLGL